MNVSNNVYEGEFRILSEDEVAANAANEASQAMATSTKGAWHCIKTGISFIWDKTKQTFIVMWNGITWTWNKIKDGVMCIWDWLCSIFKKIREMFKKE